MTVADDALRKIFKKIHENKMKEMIYKQDVIDAISPLYHEHEYRIHGKAESYSQYNEAWQDALSMVENVIFNLPATQPQRMRGRWIPDNPVGGGYWVCTACKHPTEAFAADIIYNYCPFCGADMRGEQDG